MLYVRMLTTYRNHARIFDLPNEMNGFKWGRQKLWLILSKYMFNHKFAPKSQHGNWKMLGIQVKDSVVSDQLKVDPNKILAIEQYYQVRLKNYNRKAIYTNNIFFSFLIKNNCLFSSTTLHSIWFCSKNYEYENIE